ncbi:MAG: twin-arginine translocase TatA/TatE family subunit [Proteobacteria bacterium]|nr:twin-arginine translocase TatA/TatE family subunit [Pseudomonadota bacterium]MBU1741828.1 twin-arginine translocase TatA/TatE family subunit [Pseudomonadota bacterium]
MFGLGTTEIVIILLIALVVVGPSEIPKVARALGRGMAQLRRATDELKETVEEDKDLKMIKDSFQEAADTVRGTIKYDEMFDKVFPEDEDEAKADDADEDYQIEDDEDTELNYDDVFPDDDEPSEQVEGDKTPSAGEGSAAPQAGPDPRKKGS